MTQQVYILEDKNSGLLKVGISVDVAVRVGQINKQFGCDAEVIGVLDVTDARKTERFIHGMMADYRVIGEWFDIDDNRRGYLLAYFDAPIKKRVSPRPAKLLKTSGIPAAPLAPRWKLRELLEKEDITAYALAEKMGGANRRPLIYSIVSPDQTKRPENPGFKLLEEILKALESIKSKHFELDEIIERVRE